MARHTIHVVNQQRTPAEPSTTVCAVVVTFNRRELLLQCLDHLAAQRRRPDEVLVVDNASTDGTAEALAGRSDVEVLRLPANVGGAGGFERGMEEAYARGHEWLWVLDDDTFAAPGCLEALLDGAGRAPRPPVVLSSVVRWHDDRLHPMNRPWLRLNRREEMVEAAVHGLAPIRAATFVSTMFHRRAVERHGLPAGQYFIWLDDMEYTGRILRDGHGYLVADSIVLHATPVAHTTIADARERFYFKVRNHLWLLRGSAFGGLEWLGYAGSFVAAIATYLRHSPARGRAFVTVARGLRDGFRGPR